MGKVTRWQLEYDYEENGNYGFDGIIFRHFNGDINGTPNSIHVPTLNVTEAQWVCDRLNYADEAEAKLKETIEVLDAAHRVLLKLKEDVEGLG